MSKYLMVGAAVAAMIGLAPAVAQAVQPAPSPNVLIQRAPMAAKAHTRAEVGTHVRAMFERLDTNRDGYITKAESEAARAKRGDHAGPVMKRMERHGGKGVGGAPHRGAMFDRLDTNRDGNISRSEFEAAPALQERRVVIRTDRDGAGVPGAMGPMRGMPMGMGGLGGHIFEMADANRDGRVTLQEATAAAYRHFDMADVNRDGQITREERIQMHQKMRTERRPG